MSDPNTNNDTTTIDEGESSSGGSGSKRKNKGRKKGAKKWSEDEIKLMLDIVEDELPAGSDDWEYTAARMYKEGKFNRDGSAVKAKFETLAFKEKPTGSASIPRLIMRAKDIKDKIAQEEVIGSAGLNDTPQEKGSDDDTTDEDNEGPSVALRATRLCDENGQIRRPPKPITKKKKVEAEQQARETALNAIAANQLTAARTLGDAINKLATSVGGGGGGGGDNNARIEKLERDVQGMNSKLDSIIELLAGN